MSEQESGTTGTPQDDVRIIKAFHALKIKTGPGGFDPYNIAKATRRLESSTHLFPQAALHDIHLIEETLRLLQQNQAPENSKELLRKILASCVELKAHSTMFRFPLVAQVTETLLEFCFALDDISPLAREVISEHLRALKIAIAEGPRAITPEDHTNLLDGLEKAVRKTLRQQKSE